LSKRWVNEKAQVFDEGLVGSLIVNQRTNGTMALIDGKQRKGLLLEVGKKEWMCQVFFGLSYEEEATKFYKFNGKGSRRPISPYQNFLSMLEAKNPIAINIQDVVKKYGFRLGQGGVSDNKIKAVQSATGIFIRNEGVFDRVLFLLKLTWDGDKNSFDTDLLLGMELFVRVYGDKFDNAEFASSLKKVSPTTLTNKAMSMGRYCKYVAKVMVDYYNARRTKNRLSEEALYKS
jgi:hypothetical protein